MIYGDASRYLLTTARICSRVLFCAYLVAIQTLNKHTQGVWEGLEASDTPSQPLRQQEHQQRRNTEQPVETPAPTK